MLHFAKAFLFTLLLLNSRSHLLANDSTHQFAYEPKGQTIAIGDIHADPNSFLDVLIAKKILDKDGKFIARNIDLVLTGDFADKGPDTKGVWDIINHLQKNAGMAASRVHALFGNHDNAILMTDTTRMKEEDLNRFKSFDKDPLVGLEKALVSEPYKSMMQRWKSMVKIGETVFVHGGIDTWIFDHPPGQINKTVQSYVKAQQNYLVDKISGKAARAPPIPQMMTPWVWDSGTSQPNNPFWSRNMALEKMAPATLDRILEYLGAERIVLGHTQTSSSTIEYRYGQKIILIDTTISTGFKKNPGNLSALTIDERGNVIAENHLKRNTWNDAQFQIEKKHSQRLLLQCMGAN